MIFSLFLISITNKYAISLERTRQSSFFLDELNISQFQFNSLVSLKI